MGDTIAERFKERESPYLVIEKNPKRLQDEQHYVIGDAADIRTLQKAWIEKAPAALITTHDDATNIYLTKYLRSLRPDMQILSRANLDRNVSTLHRAGADFVMSYASLGANAIFNFLKNEDTWMLAEGLNIFRLKAPESLVGKNLARFGDPEGDGLLRRRYPGGRRPVDQPRSADADQAECRADPDRHRRGGTKISEDL